MTQMAGAAQTASRPASRLALRRPSAYFIAGGFLVVALILGTMLGPVAIGPVDVGRVLLHRIFGMDVSVSGAAETIVWDIRLPRVLLAALVGAMLAMSGGAYQAVFRNPLADPYLLGVASGAGLAATVCIVLGVSLEYGDVSLLGLAAFGGGLAAVVATYAIARVGGHTPTTTLVLAGVAVSSIAVSAVSYLMLVNQRSAMSILVWLLGGFNASGWRQLWFLLPYAIAATPVLLLHGRLLNVLQLDESDARQLGVPVERTRALVLLAASLAAAAAVSVAGIIGFVGLVVPHVVRLLWGPDYRRLLPLAAILGAGFLVLADVGARTVMRPSELPVGVITAFVGAPFFLFLLRRQRKAFF